MSKFNLKTFRKLGYSYKKISWLKENGNSEQNKFIRKNKISFLVPSKGWSEKGKKIYFEKIPKSINYTFIGCLSLKRM